MFSKGFFNESGPDSPAFGNFGTIRPGGRHSEDPGGHSRVEIPDPPGRRHPGKPWHPHINDHNPGAVKLPEFHRLESIDGGDYRDFCVPEKALDEQMVGLFVIGHDDRAFREVSDINQVSLGLVLPGRQMVEQSGETASSSRFAG